MRTIAAILLIAVPLCAQRAQLAHKGRQPETGKPLRVEPVRKLPRRGDITPLPPTRPIPPPPVQPPPVLSEDRVSSLVRGSVSPLPPAPVVMELARTLPRVPAGTLAPAAVTLVAIAQPESIPNRWKIFPEPAVAPL